MPGPLKVKPYLTVEELRYHYEATTDSTLKTHLHMVLLVAEGHSVTDTAEALGFARQWVARIVHRYNRGGLQALGDKRRQNVGRPSILSDDLREELRELLQGPDPDGKRWTGPRLAKWIEHRIGSSIHVQRAYEWAEQVGHPIGRRARTKED